MNIEFKNDKLEFHFKPFPSIASYYKDARKAFKKLSNLNKLSSENAMDGLNILQANGHDICNYFARYGITNFQIQTVMKLDGKLDFDKLVKAVRLSVDAEPVFGCQFIQNDPPYWKRFADIDKTVFCSLVEINNLDSAVQKFLESPLDMDNDPMGKVRLIRSNLYDTICIKLNHACCDGAGAKEYIQLLSDIYSHISNKNSVFTPKPSMRTSKDHDRLFKAFGIKNPELNWSDLPKASIPTWKFPWKKGRRNNTHYVVCNLPDGQLDEMSKYAKSKGATINDLILTAFYRAMFKLSQPLYGVPMDISLTIDLRRYLPNQKAEAIRNLSGGINTSLTRKMHEPFEETLSRVTAMMSKVKSGHPGFENALAAEHTERMSFCKTRDHYKRTSIINELSSQNPFYLLDKCAPVLSNLGFISKPLIKFGETTVIDSYFIPPAIRAPGFLLLACTYNNILKLATSYYNASIRHADVEKLLNKIKDELIVNCSSEKP